MGQGGWYRTLYTTLDSGEVFKGVNYLSKTRW